MSINKQLDEEIVSEITELACVERGSDVYKTSVDGVTKLIDRKIELDKFDHQKKKELKAQEFEHRVKILQMEAENKDRLIKNILSGVSIGGGIVLTIWGTYKTLKFEETGTVTTSAGRRFVNRLFSWLK